MTRLLQIKEEHGAEAVVFGRATPAGSASSDFETWLIRLANAFGSPNVLATTHICTWNVLFGSKLTFGTPLPPPDYENTHCILLWGANPLATFPTSAQRIRRARARGAKLIVIDPRQHRLAREADYWLRVRPGTDAALALGMTHVLIEENLYDVAFVRTWTNGPFRSATTRSNCLGHVTCRHPRRPTVSSFGTLPANYRSSVIPRSDTPIRCSRRSRESSHVVSGIRRWFAVLPSPCSGILQRATRLSSPRKSPGSRPRRFAAPCASSQPNFRPVCLAGLGWRCIVMQCR